MPDFTLFPAETAVKLTPLAPAPIIADMPRAVFRAALAVVAALACNDGLQPTPAPTTCPKGGFVGICGTVTLRGTAPGNTAAVYIIAYNVFPQTRNDLFNFQPPFMSLNPLPHDRHRVERRGGGGAAHAADEEQRQHGSGAVAALQ